MKIYSRYTRYFWPLNYLKPEKGILVLFALLVSGNTQESFSLIFPQTGTTYDATAGTVYDQTAWSDGDYIANIQGFMAVLIAPRRFLTANHVSGATIIDYNGRTRNVGEESRCRTAPIWRSAASPAVPIFPIMPGSDRARLSLGSCYASMAKASLVLFAL
jgi:hypothetical protein